MRLGRISYFADFFFYPAAIAALTVFSAQKLTLAQDFAWALAALGGLCLWTLLEYVLHRFVLHQLPVFRKMHAAHHADPENLVGTPTWVSAVLLGVATAPLWQRLSWPDASGLTVGLMTGYLWYVTVHHVLHHGSFGRGSNFYRLKRRHALHHHTRLPCNFGVTTSFWDHAFGSNCR